MTDREEQDLRSYLGEQFGQIGERFGQMDERFGQIDERFEQIDQHFSSLEHELRTGLEENRQHFGVIAESLKADIRLLAEGHDMLFEGQERIRLENRQTAAEIRVEQHLVHTDANRRVDSLERRVTDLDSRVETIEEKLGG